MLNVGELAEAYKEQHVTSHPNYGMYTTCLSSLYLWRNQKSLHNKAAIIITLQYDLERIVTWLMSLDVLANKF